MFENVYFKQGGELTSLDESYYSTIGGDYAVDPDFSTSLPDVAPGSMVQREPRANLLYPNNSSGLIAGMTQVQKDGKRYIYGQPIMNNLQKEVTFSVQPPNPSDLSQGLVAYTSGVDDAASNNNGLDQYYNCAVMPQYAHSFLLTSILSADYVDITGDGISDDDLGSYTTFHYTTKETDYRWKAPFSPGKAQYDPGFWSEPRDDKGSYVAGSRQVILLNEIETKNFIAEFYTSQRNDGCGSTEALVTTGEYATSPYNSALSSPAHSYKLDSIKLFNKRDYIVNGTNAVPIKTVLFVYDYSLCPAVPNTIATDGSGKLTLRKIYFRYGNSQKSMLSPYQFNYGYNPSYAPACKDRWGNYKPNNSSFTNYEFPYVNQDDTANNT